MEQELLKIYQMQIPLAANGVFWNGKPDKWSNLPGYRLVMTQRFGMNLMDYSKFGMRGHNGIDIAGILGSQIVAPIKLWINEVTTSRTGYGLYVKGETEVVEINGKKYKLELAFGHFNEIKVKAYQWVEAGTLLGLMGTTGYSSGVHLHFGIRIWMQNGNDWVILNYDNGYLGYIDPEPFMPHIVWDYSELINEDKKNMDIQNFIKENDLKLIQNKDNGEFGYIYAGKLRTADDGSRAVLMLFAYLHRTNGGITIDSATWDKLPKENF